MTLFVILLLAIIFGCLLLSYGAETWKQRRVTRAAIERRLDR